MSKPTEYAIPTAENIARWFDEKPEILAGATILMGFYETGNWEGYAFVLFERDGKLYEVHGSHCSCYGLEDQWGEEDTTWDALAMRSPSFYSWPGEEIAEFQRLVFLHTGIMVNPRA
jgi:hypothetical protein